MSDSVPETLSHSVSSALSEHAANLATAARDLADQAEMMAMQAGSLSALGTGGGGSFLVTGLTVFVLACFVGYYVVWRVTPALHSPLMGITNAISSVIIVGALIAVGMSETGFSKFMGFMAVTLASVNIFGGFIITRRMLSMFRKKG
ncbi:MAG TPA: proton-translocating transhydrogenase family protein [Alphaproteobacteria bacterium]|nr:proton-translocating transhydrogenase family protein [Alphaproteobacteria bacterium]